MTRHKTEWVIKRENSDTIFDSRRLDALVLFFFGFAIWTWNLILCWGIALREQILRHLLIKVKITDVSKMRKQIVFWGKCFDLNGDDACVM